MPHEVMLHTALADSPTLHVCLSAASVDGLVEASRQSRVCAGAANDIACMIFRVLMEVCLEPYITFVSILQPYF